MEGPELLVVALVALVLLGVPLVALILGIVALVRTSRIGRLEARLAQLEVALSRPPVVPPVSVPFAEPAAPEIAVAAVVEEPVSAELETIVSPRREPAIQWELLIGQKALGWVAVVLAIFAAAFFLKYAYDNNWIGPQGRVAVGEIAGSLLMLAGLRYHRREWRIFSQMLSACGVVVLYLSTYSAFGFYHLLPNYEAGGFLAAIVILSMVAAVLYDAPAIALVAVLGGLLTPLLLSSEKDAYESLFVYLTLLNVGVGLVTLCRGWAGLGSLALVGTQVLFWLWYGQNYHPEKLGWAVGFQVAVFGLYLLQDLAVQFQRLRGARWESAARMLANAAFWFTAFFVLYKAEARPWMGTAALVMAALYASIGRALIGFQGRHTVELLTAVSLSVGFLALAIPLEADARWVALGWAACAATLWWFGVRVSAIPLRALAACIAAVSLLRLFFLDLPSYPQELLTPILNRIALPSVGVTVVLLTALVLTRRHTPRLDAVQRALAGVAAVVVLVSLWIVLSADVYHHFRMRSELASDETVDWRRLGQMSLSVLWTLYASGLLTIGFRWRLAGLRWLAIAFFGITVVKVFLLDMAGLSQLYRIVAFVVLAVFLGLAARVYQRVGRRTAGRVPGETD